MLGVFTVPLCSFFASMVFMTSPLWVGRILEEIEWFEKKTVFSVANATSSSGESFLASPQILPYGCYSIFFQSKR
jgi:hypothetical protein